VRLGGTKSKLARCFPDSAGAIRQRGGKRRELKGSGEGDVILRPHRNIWRLERAHRAAVLIDAGRYFGALREALIQARSNVFIVGWDLDSRTRLVGESGVPGDGYPETFIAFLTALVNERPSLTVYLLVWDYSVLYALEREPFPTLSLGWRAPRRIRYCLDDDLPAGASHHQKLVVVDDAVAFCGGLDVTIRRWDTREHRLDDPRRVDPSGSPYPPFHDVQAVVDGDAATALAELSRERWLRAGCSDAPPLQPTGDPWPQHVAPDFRAAEIGIARTLPASEEGDEVREIEALFLDAIDQAERMIYIENQFLTATRIAERLARRLAERPALETVVIMPKAHHSWLETQLMATGRSRFMRVLAEAGVLDRVAVLCPHVRNGATDVDVMVHSKLMVVDDVLLHVGSANLNNRSIGLDTECDLAIEARSEDERQAVARLRNRLLGHHCGLDTEEVAAALARTGSMIKTALTLKRGGHYLAPVDHDSIPVPAPSAFESLADPDCPISAPPLLEKLVGERPKARQLRRLAKLIAAGAVIIALMLAWRFTPLASFARPDTLRQWLAAIPDAPAAPLLVIAVFVGGGLIVFPVLVLIAATAAAFGPWLGFAYAFAGAIASAIVTYAIGAAIGRDALETVFRGRLDRVRRAVVERGVFAIAAIRLVPIAPFTLVNMVAGASEVRFADYLIGTIIGMAPGITTMSALGYQIWTIVMHPTLVNVVIFVLAVIGWLGVTLGAQALILRRRRHRPA
jgi:phosphatidylserine/phosphatidylglycerophosphate/cardiolipin synthase-like enzyme/uncharacterized membrane protein YdjX (TVP38/TMEM64 family)